MDCNVFNITVFLLLYYTNLILCIDVDYINTACDSSPVNVTTSRQLESGTGLSYAGSLSCFYHVVVPTGRQVMLFSRRFDLEYKVDGVCVDFINIHDGSNTSAATLNSSPLCGEDGMSLNFTSTGNDITIYFESDATASGYGFEFLFVSYQTGSCKTSDLACTTGLCIDESLKCNNKDECGDNSDETDCSVEPTGLSVHPKTALIAGLSVGLFFALLIGLLLVIYTWKQNRWRVFAKRPLTAKHYIHNETTFSEAYPVTKFYYKEPYQSNYRMPESPEYIGDNEWNLNRQMVRDATVMTSGQGAVNHGFDVNEKEAVSSSPVPEWKTWEKAPIV